MDRGLIKLVVAVIIANVAVGLIRKQFPQLGL